MNARRSLILLLAILLCAAASAATGPLTLRLSRTAGGPAAEGLVFNYRIGDPVPEAAAAQVTSNLGSVPFAVNIRISSPMPWLDVTPAFGRTPETIRVLVNPAGLEAGTYTGEITVQTTLLQDGRIVDAWDRSTITLVVTAPPETSTAIVTPPNLGFSGAIGEHLDAQTIAIATSPLRLNYSTASDSRWLSATPGGVTNSAPIQVMVATDRFSSAGTYSGNLTISVPGGNPSSIVVPVVLTLKATTSALTQTPPASLTFNAVKDGRLPAPQSFSVAAGKENVPFQLQAPPPGWLSIIPQAGQTPQRFTIFANQAGLAPGTYTYAAKFSYPTTAPGFYTTEITLNVAAQMPGLAASPGAISFSATAGGPNPPPASIDIEAAVDGNQTAVAASAAADVDWLEVSAGASQTPSVVQVRPRIGGLAPGTRTGKVRITAAGADPSSLEVPVTLHLAASATVQASPNAIAIEGRAGETPASPQAFVRLSTESEAALSFTITPGADTPWLKASLQTGSVSATRQAIVNLTADSAGLAAGVHSGALAVTLAGESGPAASIPVTFEVAPAAPAIEVSATRLSFQAWAGGSTTAAQTVDVSTNSSQLAFSVEASEAWLKATPASGQGSQALAVAVDPASLSPGKYAGEVKVTAGADVRTIGVELAVNGTTLPAFTADVPSIAFTQAFGSPGALRRTVSLLGLDERAAGNLLIEWSVSATTAGGGRWLAASPIDAREFPLTFEVYADTASLDRGSYEGTLTVKAAGATTRAIDIPVRLTVTDPESYTPSPAALSAKHMAGEDARDVFAIDLTPAAPGLTYTASVTGGAWLKMEGAATGTLPAAIRVLTDTAGLETGVYRGAVQIEAAAPGGAAMAGALQTVPVTLTVTERTPPRIEVHPISNGHFLGMFLVDRDAPAADHASTTILSIRNAGAGTVPVAVVSSAPWLQFDQSTVAVSSEPVELAARVRTDRIPAGTGVFGGAYKLTTAEGVVYSGVATLQVRASSPQFEVRPVAETLSAIAGYAQPLTTTALLVNTGATPFTPALSDDADWVSTAMDGGPLGAGEAREATIAIAPGLGLGTHNATVSFRVAAGSAVIDRTFNIAVEVRASGQPQVMPGNMVAAVHPGDFSQEYTIVNPGADGLSYLVTAAPYSDPYEYRTCTGTGPSRTCAWVPAVRTLPAAVSSIENATGTVPAGGSAIVKVRGTAGTSASASSLYFRVGPGSLVRTLYVAPASSAAMKGLKAGSCSASDLAVFFRNLNRQSSLTAGLPAAVEAQFIDGCGRPVSTGWVTAQFSNGDARVMLQPVAAGVWAGTWVPLNASVPEVEIALTAVSGDGSLATQSKLTVGVAASGGVPYVASGGVVNPGDYGSPMAAAPGSYLSIFGTGMASASAAGFADRLEGTAVTLGGRPLPLIFVSPGQINAFVPYDIPPDGTLPLQVVREEGRSLSHPVVMDSRNPALFLRDGSTARPGLVIAYRGAESFLVDSANPVQAGDSLVLYSLGLGPVDQDLAPSRITPTSPLARVKGAVEVTIGGKPAEVLFAGLSPGSLGLFQVNAKVPAGVPAGNQVPVVVTVEGQSTSAVMVSAR